MSDEELLHRAMDGTMTEEEIRGVVGRLQSPGQADNPYMLLHILGHYGDPQWTSLVERYVDYPQDAMVASMALQVLDQWGRVGEYLPWVRRLVAGMTWDEEGYARLAAIDAAGDYLRSADDPALLRDIIGIFENEAEKSIMRQAAYTAIGIAVGRARREMPPPSLHFDFHRDVDLAILRAAELRAAPG